MAWCGIADLNGNWNKYFEGMFIALMIVGPAQDFKRFFALPDL